MIGEPLCPPRVRAVSFGAGVQSTALLVMAARKMIDYPLFIFANTGDDSEHPDSLTYLREVAMPYAAENGIEMVEVRRDGPTLLQAASAEGSDSFPLPFRGDSGAPMNRSCTVDWKIRVVANELRRRGATTKNPADVALGISTDEIQRAKSPGSIDPRSKGQRRWYPLIDARMNRNDCQALIADEGLPVPGKSACWFCPWHSRDAWLELRNDTPELFDAAVELERRYKERATIAGHTRTLWITDHGAARKATLDQVVDDQQTMFDVDECSGFCHT